MAFPLLAGTLVAFPTTSRASGPSSPLASETYVAISSPSEVETVDDTSGAVVGTASATAYAPISLATWNPAGSASPEVLEVVADTSEATYLQEMDPLTGAQSSTISVPDATEVVTSNQSDYALVVSGLDETVYVVDLATFSYVGEVAVDDGWPSGISMAPDGSYAYVTSYAHAVTTLEPKATSPFWKVDDAYTGSSDFNPTDMTISNDSDTAYVTDGDNIDVVSLAGGGFSPSSSIALTGAAGSSSISPDDSTLYVQMRGTDDVAAIDTATSSVSYDTATVTAGQVSDADGGSLLAVSSASSSDVDLIDPTDDSVLASVGLDGTPSAVASPQVSPLHPEAFVALHSAGEVAMVDPTDGIVNQKVSVGADPSAIALSPDGTYAYVANAGSDSVSVLDTENLDTSSSVSIDTVSLPTGSGPSAIAVDPSGDRALVTDEDTGEISVLDTNAHGDGDPSLEATPIYLDGSGTESSAIEPTDIVFSPDGNYAYVTEKGGDEITILDLSSPETYTYSANFSVSVSSRNLVALAMAPNDQDLYVTGVDGSSSGRLWDFPVNSSSGGLSSPSYIAVTGEPHGVSLSPNGDTIYVASHSADTVSIVQADDFSATPTTVSVSSAEQSAMMPDGQGLLVTDLSSPGLSVMDLDANDTGSYDSVSSTISLPSGSDPEAVAVSPGYYASYDGTLVGYEDDTNPSVAATSSAVDTEDGVNTATGAYTLDLDSLSLPDIGTSLDLSESYDSEDAGVDGPLGYGWAFSYGMNLAQVPAGSGSTSCDVTVEQQNDTPATFDLPYSTAALDSCPTSGYEPPTFEQATLSQVPDCYDGDACWEMTTDATTQYLFDTATGDLVFEKDLNGNTTTLAYASGQLSSVTGPSGQRSLDFTWSGSHISEVEDSAGRTLSFTYSSGDLASITLDASSTGDPNTHEWAFSYDGSNEMTDWWSPDNEATYASEDTEATRIAYSGGVVTSVTDPDWLTQCDGDSGSPYCAPETTFAYPSFDAGSETGTVEIDDANFNDSLPDGDVTLDVYVDGRLQESIDGYGDEPDSSTPMSSDVSSSIADPFTWMASESLDGDGDLTTDSYDASANVISSVDGLGNTTTSLYNSFDQVVESTNPLGGVTSYTYDSDGNELTATDPDGGVTSYAYNDNGEQCARLSPDGYASGDRLTSCPGTSAPYVTVYGYDAEGDQVSETEYDGTANTVSETYVTTELFNAAGEQCASLTADGNAAGDSLADSCPDSGGPYETVDSSFDAFGNVLSSISPTNATGGATTYTYDADGNQLTETDPGDQVTTNAYNPDDELCWSEPLSVEGPSCTSPPTGSGTQTTTYTYDPDGNQLATVSPDGNAGSYACLYTTTSIFDNPGNVVSTTTPNGGTNCGNKRTTTTTSVYDADGNVVSSVDGSDVTTSVYDADGDLVSDTAGTGADAETTTYTYDADGNELTETDPGDEVTTNTYNSDDELCWTEPLPVVDPTCGSPPTGSGTDTTTYYYDADGNELAETGQDGDPATCDPLTTSACADTTYDVYDEQDLEISSTDPNGNETTYTYDADGNELTETEPSSTEGTDTYNGAGELIEESYTDGTPTVSYQYNADGQRCWMYQGVSTASCASPPSGASTYSYDSSGRLVSETNAAGGTVTYGYDASSNISCVSYPNASNDTCASPGSGLGVVHYSYNDADQLSSLTNWAGDTLTFAYNGQGQECWVSTYAPGTPSCDSAPAESDAVTTAYSYDDLGDVSDISTTTGAAPTNLLDLSVGSRTADGFIETETATVGTTTEPTDVYQYNELDQVSSGPIVGGSGSTSYAYSPMGSITADTTAFQSAGYDASGALCWTDAGSSPNACGSPPPGSTVYSTNSDGERTATTPASGDPESYGWETDSGLLVCANTDGSSCSASSPSSSTTVYTYDGDGLRTSATTDSATTDYTWGTAGAGPQLLSDGTWDYLYAPGSAAPIEQIAASGDTPAVDLLLSDESGNVRGLVQLSGGTNQDQLVNYTDYDAYGDPITAAGGSAEAGGLTVPQTSLSSNYIGSTPWGFGEGYADATGLVYLVNRYYDPETGQFLSADPLSNLADQSYLYSNDNPIGLSDPDGLSATASTIPDTPNPITEACEGANGHILEAMCFFVDQRWTVFRAAAIVGNLMQESSVQLYPWCEQSNSGCVHSGGGPGFGIAQWGGARRNNLLDYDRKHGGNGTWRAVSHNFVIQEDFIVFEMSTDESEARSALKAANTIDAATVAFEENYEQAGTPDMSQREQYAHTARADWIHLAG